MTAPQQMFQFAASSIGSPFPPVHPVYPNPPPNCYVLGILKFCHKNVSVCYGCGGRLQNYGYPVPVVMSKTKRIYIDPVTHQRFCEQFSNIYYHFNYSCISAHNSLFTPQFITVPADLLPHLSPDHIQVLKKNHISC